MSLISKIPHKMTISVKIAIISLAGLAGLLLVGGIGYWACSDLAANAENALKSEIQALNDYADTSELALEHVEQAKKLADLNAGLIRLQQTAVEGPLRRSKGITAEDILTMSKELEKKARIVKGVPGNERPVEGTKLTLGDQVLMNFTDVSTFLEFELPEVYAEEPGTEAFSRKQGEMIVSLTNMFWFISRTLDDLAANLATEVDKSRDELAQVAKKADILTNEVTTQLQDSSQKAKWGIVAVFSVTVALLGVAFPVFGAGIIRPLRKTVSMADELKKGRINVRLDVGSRKDEFGEMAMALNEFADDLEHEVVRPLQAMAEGTLTVQVTPYDDQDVIRVALQKTIHDLKAVLGQIQVSGEQIDTGSNQVAQSSQMLSQGATEQASSLEEIAASVNEMESMTKLTADHAGQASRLSLESKDKAESGSAHMQHMVAAMSEIRAAGDSISKIVKSIDEIAFQTNLLALNASVEAARAGQHGKGFAVVAEEVRNLASRSAEAAKETASLIQGTVDKTRRGTEIADRASLALGEILSEISKVTDLVAEISAASTEQAEGISQINTGLTRIDHVTQQNTASAEESAAAAEQLSEQAARLREMLERFRC